MYDEELLALRKIGDALAATVVMALNQCGPLDPEQKHDLRGIVEVWCEATEAIENDS